MKDKDFKTFLKELDDLVMSKHRRLMNITLRCGDPVDDFNNQVNILKYIRNVIKKYKKPLI